MAKKTFITPLVGIAAGLFMLPHADLPSTAAKQIFLLIFSLYFLIYVYFNRRFIAEFDKKITVLSTLWLGWVILVNYTSDQVANPLTGSPGWNDGILTSFSYIVIFLFSASKWNNINSRHSDLIWILNFSAVSISILSIAEFIGFRPLLGSAWWDFIGGGSTYPSAAPPVLTMGNSAWLGGLLLIPTAFFIVNYQKNNYLLGTIISLGIGSVHSKAVLLSFIITCIISMIVNIILSDNRNPYRIVYFIFVIAVSTLSTQFLVLSSQFLKNLGLVQQKLEIHPDYQTSASSRFIIWKGTFRMITQKFITGWGDDTLQNQIFYNLNQNEYETYIKSVFPLKSDEIITFKEGLHIITKKNSSGNLILIGKHDIVRPHNFILEEIYSHGVVGFLLSTWIILLVARKSFQSESRLANNLSITVGVYMIFLLFWFTTPGSTALAAALLGLAYRIADETENPRDLLVTAVSV